MITHQSLVTKKYPNKKVIVIVDAYSSSNQYAPLLKLKYDIIHIQSTLNIAKDFEKSFQNSDFQKNICFDGSLEKLIQHLKSFNIAACFAGTESGVVLADEISSSLKLNSNDRSLTLSRRNKWELAKTLSKNKLSTPKQFQTNNLEDAIDFVKSKLQWPTVIKPVASCGSDSVFIVDNLTDLKLAFNKILNSLNKLNEKNEKVLVQEYLHGTEYAVNYVACKGFYYLSSVWRYHKKITKDGHIIYDFDELLNPNNTLVKNLDAYCQKVLAAMKIEYGPVHCELVKTKQDFKVLDFASRLSGVSNLDYETHCINHDSINLSLYSWVNHEKFFSTLNKTKKYSRKKYAIIISLIGNYPCYKINQKSLNKIKNLPSFFSLKLRKNIKETFNRTIDLFTSPGYIFLFNDDYESLKKDYIQIRQLEIKGLYDEIIK